DMLSRAYGIGSYASFWLDQPSGTIEFREATGQTKLIAKIIPVGSHSTRSDTWMWAWANESIPQVWRERAGVLRELEDVTGVKWFGEPVINVTTEIPWELTAFAVRHLGALGAYRAANRDSVLYVAIVDITRV